MIAALIVIYLSGYVVAATIAGHTWFNRFGAEFEGVAWAMFLAVMWPIIALPYLVWLVIRGFYV